MNDLYLMIGSYFAVLLMAVFIVNWMSGGLIMPLMRVKSSRGKLVLCRIRTIPSDYFVPAKIMEGFLIYKDREKNQRRISFPGKECITRSLGVNCVDLDDEKNAIVMPDFNVVTGFDPVKFDNLITRALMAAAPQDKLLIIVVICCVITLLVSIVSVIMLIKLGGKIDLLTQMSTAVQSVVPN